MDTNAEVPSFSNFGIEEPLVGNLDLLKDLYEPETQTAKPEDVTPIIEETKPIPPPTKPEKKKGDELSTDAPIEEQTGEDVLKNFLGKEDDDSGDDDTLQPPLLEKQDEASEEFSQYDALAKDLFKLGVFTPNEGEEDISVKTPEEFLERFNNEKQKGAYELLSNFIGKFGEDYQQAFEAIYVKGVPPKDYFGTYNTIVKFAELDLTKEENQELVIKQSLTDQGWEGSPSSATSPSCPR